MLAAAIADVERAEGLRQASVLHFGERLTIGRRDRPERDADETAFALRREPRSVVEQHRGDRVAGRRRARQGYAQVVAPPQDEPAPAVQP